MITLSEMAANKVRQLLDQESRADIALRVAVQPGGCFVVDRMSMPYLKEAKIDFVDSLDQSGFTIDNPLAQGGCACGHSFH